MTYQHLTEMSLVHSLTWFSYILGTGRFVLSTLGSSEHYSIGVQASKNGEGLLYQKKRPFACFGASHHPRKIWTQIGSMVYSLTWNGWFFWWYHCDGVPDTPRKPAWNPKPWRFGKCFFFSKGVIFRFWNVSFQEPRKALMKWFFSGIMVVNHRWS